MGHSNKLPVTESIYLTLQQTDIEDLRNNRIEEIRVGGEIDTDENGNEETFKVEVVINCIYCPSEVTPFSTFDEIEMENCDGDIEFRLNALAGFRIMKLFYKLCGQDLWTLYGFMVYKGIVEPVIIFYHSSFEHYVYSRITEEDRRKYMTLVQPCQRN